MKDKKNIFLKLFFSIRKFLIYAKVWMQRSMSWVAILNSGMILFLLLSKLQDYGYGIYITAWFFPIFIVTLLLMIFFGYLEDKAGFHREETREVGKRNPYFEDIIRRLDKIEKEIKEIRTLKKK